jgi:hypothetical protein
LDAATTGWNETLDSSGIKGASKLFLLRLHALDHRNCKQLLVDASVEFKDVKHLLVGFRLGQVSRMTFLPQIFTGPEEWLWEGGSIECSKDTITVAITHEDA